jgi:hypothetical protein
MSTDCIDCGVNTAGFVEDGQLVSEDYIVQFALWATVCPDVGGFICIGCFEKRLGRELTTDDFLLVPDPTFWGKFPDRRISARLASRLGSEGLHLVAGSAANAAWNAALDVATSPST